MTHKLNFFPLGNADCCRIDLAGGQKILFDCANTRGADDPEDKRCDLHAELRGDLAASNRDFFDAVAFTHLDRDHYCGASELFFLEHAKKYQGAGRIKMNVMWVPAAVITEEVPEEDDYAEARIIQAEARYRFKKKSGIRIFSRPERLKDWCEDNDVSLEDRRTLVTDAGWIAPEFSLAKHGVEFFVHSPFAIRQNENTVEDRNGDGIIMQAILKEGSTTSKVLLMADATHETLRDIVKITKQHGREERLEWDVAKLPHHCSYLSLGPEKGENKTQPIEEVAWLYEEQAQDGAIIVSTSKPIPEKGSDEDVDPNPPHREAANYYKEILDGGDGQFVVTMEHPKPSAPKAVVIEIGSGGTTLKVAARAAAVVATSRPAPRAG
jgi:hypothetical protein